MKPIPLILLLALAGGVSAADPARPDAMPMQHAVTRAADTAWGPVPPMLPGAQAAVLAGDPGKEGSFTIRLKMPAGYRVPRHCGAVVQVQSMGPFVINYIDPKDDPRNAGK